MSALTEWRPFTALNPLLEQMPNFDDMVRRMMGDLPAPIARWQPRANVTETADAYCIRLEIPGVKPEEVKVTVTDDTLTIQGEKTEEACAEDEQLRVYERGYGSFLRAFTFPANVDREAVSAESDNGVLTITINKGKEAQARAIPVKRIMTTSATAAPANATAAAPKATAAPPKATAAPPKK